MKLPLLPFASLALILFVTANSAHAGGDPDKGQKVFNKCKICHDIGEGAKVKIGPPLNDIIGAQAGARDGFSYSTAMKSADLVWTEEKLSVYLENPRQIVPGTKMVFPGLKKDSERADVIAYLKQFSKPQ